MTKRTVIGEKSLDHQEENRHGITRGFTSPPWDKHWTPELVAEEAKSLARQIAKFIEPVSIELT
ncbi:hypothetical protein F0Q45_08270 [Mycobacterium simiae]|uniref:Uncharacterized protein n=1 Tax=Mycobacterium simiae TaxID=1784 RepID=A0A5B1BTG9_MYCSI|nr:hypothetical protein [Mycobacterium simiae]KAA1250683.1 hypothetical protein F0Q45_08270 [Mycobacterium simiae]